MVFVVRIACSCVKLPPSVSVSLRACVRFTPSLCMATGLLHCVTGQPGLFNGSYDITFSLDYRRLDDGSSSGYSNNRWAKREDVGLNAAVCVRHPV